MKPLPAILTGKRIVGRGLGEVRMPEAPYYVVMDDVTWTKILDRRIINVFPCGDEIQADPVLKYATANPYETDPRITRSPPEPGDDRILVVFPPEDVRAWEEFGASRMLSG